MSRAGEFFARPVRAVQASFTFPPLNVSVLTTMPATSSRRPARPAGTSSRSARSTPLLALLGLLGLVAALAQPAAAAPSAAPSSSAGAGAGSTSANDQRRATFGVGPVSLGKNDPRSYFSYEMGVGGIYTDKAAVLNYGTVALNLSIFAADLGNADNGAIAVGLQGQPQNDAGKWITLPASNLVLRVPARTSAGPGEVIVPFRITVPHSASPGDHGAAIVAVLTTIGKNPKGQNVRLDQRVASRIYLRVNGPLHPRLAIENLTVKYKQSLNPLKGGTATVSYTVHNVGNIRLAAKQAVSVTGMFGTKSKVVTPDDVQLLFPGATQRVTVKVRGVFPSIMEDSKVSVTPQLFQDQQPMPVPTATATKSFTAIPWVLLAILAAILLLIAAIWWLRRRASRRPPRPPRSRHGGGPDGPTEPQPDPQLTPPTPEKIAT
jgi:hypothetical protein